MILSSFMIVLFIIFMVLMTLKEKIMYPAILKMAGILLIVFSLILYSTKMTTYHSNLGVEYELYLYLSRIRISIDTIALIADMGIALFLVSEIVYLRKIISVKKGALIFLSILTVILFIINGKKVEEYIYFIALRQIDSVRYVKAVTDIVNGFMVLILLIFIITPYIANIHSYRKTKIYYKKRELLSSLIVWVIMDCFGIATIYANKLDKAMFYNLSLLKYPIEQYSPSGNISIIVCMVFLLATGIIISIKYSPFGMIARTRNIEMLSKENENTIMMMHTYKNAFCSIKMLTAKENDLGAPEERLDRIQNIAEEYSDKIETVIKRFRSTEKNMQGIKTEVDIVQTMESAIRRSKIDFPVIREYSYDSITAIADEFQIGEAFLCLLNNAYEAFDILRTDKEITVKIATENNDIYVNITDNGCGISNENKNKIFNPLFSSKKGGANMGMGLPYTYKVARNHGGCVDIKSKEGKYTTVQMAIKKEGRRYE